MRDPLRQCGGQRRSPSHWREREGLQVHRPGSIDGRFRTGYCEVAAGHSVPTWNEPGPAERRASMRVPALIAAFTLPACAGETPDPAGQSAWHEPVRGPTFATWTRSVARRGPGRARARRVGRGRARRRRYPPCHVDRPRRDLLGAAACARFAGPRRRAQGCLIR